MALALLQQRCYNDPVKRVLRTLGLVLTAITLTAVMVVGVLAWQINRLGGQDLAQPADAIVILGARVNADGSPSSDLLSRTFHAIDLYNAGRISKEEAMLKAGNAAALEMNLKGIFLTQGSRILG